MARYDMDYGRSYGLGYTRRERFAPAPRPGRSRTRMGAGWRERMGRGETGYGEEFGPRERIGYGREYTLESSATDEAGLVTRNNASFSTLTPEIMTAAYLTVGEGEVVGIGQPVAVMFDEPIADRQAAQDAIHVTTTPEVEGAFYWVSNQEVRWRPAEYWAPGTKVDVHVDIYGKDMGGGMYGQEDNQATFRIGDAVVSRVDDSTKQIVIERNGEVVKTMPTSMGKGGWATYGNVTMHSA